jgi:D-threo-aldose 1-dehydrogenase
MKANPKGKLGRVNLEVTALGLGTVALGNLFKAVTEAEAANTIAAAWESGIRYYDTAALYGHGLGELRLGHALRGKRRDDFTLSSKVGRRLNPRRRGSINFGGWVDAAPFELVYDYSYDGTLRAFDDALQRLALEHMDICFIHDIDVFTRGAEQPEVFRQAMDGCYRALDKLRTEGALKAIGVGVNEWEVCHEALKQRDFDCFLLAGRYSLLEQEPLTQFLPLCVDRNVSVVIGGGFNSGILATGAIEGSRYNYGPRPRSYQGTRQQHRGRLRRVRRAHASGSDAIHHGASGDRLADRGCAKSQPNRARREVVRTSASAGVVDQTEGRASHPRRCNCARIADTR